MSYKKFEKVYKKLLSDYKRITALGALKMTGDYRDLVHNGVAYALKKYDFKDDDFHEKEIFSILRRNISWQWVKLYQGKNNEAQVHNKVHLSQLSYELDQYDFGDDAKQNLSFDKFDLENNGLNLIVSRINGETREDQIKSGKFRTMRVAQYAHEKEAEKFKNLISFEQRQLSKTW